MPTSYNHLLEPQPDSLIAEAFRAANGGGAFKSLGVFVAHCMNNGDPSATPPSCILDCDFRGPELVDLTRVRRTVGVGPKTEITEDHDAFYGNIERITERIQAGTQPAPFIMERREDDWYYLRDGNHTKVALERLGLSRWWAITLKPVVTCQLVPVEAQAA